MAEPTAPPVEPVSAARARHEGAEAARKAAVLDETLEPPADVPDYLRQSWITGYQTEARLIRMRGEG